MMHKSILLLTAVAALSVFAALECVDFNNYSPDVRKVLRAFSMSEGKGEKE